MYFLNFFSIIGVLAVSSLSGCSNQQEQQAITQVNVIDSDDVLSAVGNSSSATNGSIKISSHETMAGAISSLIWNGKEFINNFDHGRQYQIAMVINNLTSACPECYNPTEAGNRLDGHLGQPSTSKLQTINYSGNVMQTSSFPAYWMEPNEVWSSEKPMPAVNTTEVSDYLFSKRVELGVAGVKEAIQFDITINTPRVHSSLQIEAPTAYLTADFKKIYSFDYDTDALTELNHDYQVNKFKSVIIATNDGKYAMGAWAPAQNNTFTFAGYFTGYMQNSSLGKQFDSSKWSIVMIGSNIPAGNLQFRSYQFVGSLKDVKKAIKQVVGIVTGNSITATSVISDPISSSAVQDSNSAAGSNSARNEKKEKEKAEKEAKKEKEKAEKEAKKEKEKTSQSATVSSSAKYDKGLFKVGEGIYFSNGSDAYCAFSSPQHLKRCGKATSSAVPKSSLPDGMRYDGACGC